MSRELLQQALKHIQNFKSDWMRVPPFADKVNKATRFAISNAHGSIFQLEQDLIAELAKPEQEPVAYVEKGDLYWCDDTSVYDAEKLDGCGLYPAPPRKEWVGKKCGEKNVD